jgi:hypothetical protein
MDVVSEILDVGMAAIKTYMECVGGGFNEDSVSERSLSALMALELYKQSGLHAIPEAPYTRIVDDLHMKIEEPERTQMVGLHADIALYHDNRQPLAVVELKIFSDGKDPLPQFARDLNKGDPMSLDRRIPIYAAALICETEHPLRSLDDQKEWIERGIGQPLRYSPTEQTGTGQGWKWCFGSTERQNSNRNSG